MGFSAAGLCFKQGSKTYTEPKMLKEYKNGSTVSQSAEISSGRVKESKNHTLSTWSLKAQKPVAACVS